jgi:hypothetical protein
MKGRWALNLSSIKTKIADYISKHASIQIMLGQFDIFTPSNVPNKIIILNIKSSQFGRVKKATLFTYRLGRNNNEVWQQDIKIKIKSTVMFMLQVKNMLM